MGSLGRFEGQVALITGGGGGIGKATALRLASEGARIVVTDYNREFADAAAKEVTASGAKAIAITLDVGDSKAVDDACARAVKEYGRLDVVVCAAGIRASKPLAAADHTHEEWQKVLDVNLLGAFYPASAGTRYMVAAGKGSVVFLSSINALRAAPGQVAYNAAKAAVISMTQTFAIELARRGVRVNAVAPAQIDTPLTAMITGEKRTMREEQIPIGRFGRPEEVAAAIAFLASDDASFITGTTLLVDGGRYAMQHRHNFPFAT
jgi:meso-butanediol dehydrogenase / (S,S)-butanediol dehydrogenase / diacetyl reductase